MSQLIQKSSGVSLVDARRSKDFSFSEVLYPPQLRQPRHTHTYASMSFVLAGNYLENYGKKSESRQPSTVVFHPPRESHAVYFENNVRILNVEFSFEKFDYIRECSAISDEPASCRTGTINYLGRRIYQEFKQMDAFSILAVEGLILEMLAETARQNLSRAEKKLPRWLAEAKEFLHENFAQSLRLEEIAKIADVHPVHLSRVFRRNFGCTIGEYMRRLRVEFAAKQILLTDLSLGEIAHAAGFSDQSHFNKTFKNAYGLTPAEHRKNSRRS